MGHKLIKIYLYSIVLLILGFIVSFSSYLSSSASADSSGVESVTINLPISCTISGSNNTHSETLVNNTYDSNIGGTDQSPNSNILTTYCNDKDGYIIYAIGASNNEEGNTNLIGDNGSNISTNVYTPGDTTSSWSFKLTNLDNILTIPSSYTDFHTIPDEWTEIAKKPSGTVDSTTGAKFSTTYAAYISGTQAAGTYTGQVKYVMFHPSSATRPVTLAKAFENAGKQKVHATDPLTGESGEYYTMQDMTTSICNATNVMGEASQTKLVDTRDGKLYWVTKLRTDKNNDNVGQCWMTQNLDLDLETTPTNVAALTSENTNLKLYGSMGYTTANGYSCSNPNTTTNCTASGEVITLVPERNTSTILSSWGSNVSKPYSYDSGLETPNGVMNGHGYTGNYYNWTAAIASNNSSSYSTNNTIAANSICPKGWRLPNAASMTGGYEFSKLLYAYGVTKDATNGNGYATGGFNKIIANPLYFVRAGSIGRTSVSNSGSDGYYWSSVNYRNDDQYAYYLHFSSTGVEPNKFWYYGNEGRGDGKSLRCLAE